MPLLLPLLELSGCSMLGDGDLLNGLWDGVTRADLLAGTPGMASMPLPMPPGNREGTVPARARLVGGKLSGVGS